MAIQFYCPECRKPIEIDDEAGNQAVTCPYCQKVITAPGQSDPSFSQPTVPPGETGLPTPPLPYAGQPAPVGNRLGWTALWCAVALVLCLGAVMAYSLVQAKDIPPGTSPTEAAKILQKKMQGPAYMALSLMGSCVVPAVGITCAIAALVRRRQPLWPAIVGLVVFVVYLLLACAGIVYQVSLATGKAGS